MDISLPKNFPKLYDLSINKSVSVRQSGCFGPRVELVDKFRRNLTGHVVEEYIRLNFCQWSLKNQQDCRVWKWKIKGQFTVKSYYDFLNFRGITFAATKIWSIAVP